MSSIQSFARRLYPSFFVVIVLLLFGSRFIHLLADFPSGINWSGDLYTDEGWYSSGAVRFFISGHWIVPGDFNPVINLPIFQIAVFIGFKIFGMSLLSVRLVALIFFAFLLITIFLLTKTTWGIVPAFLSIAFLCSDYLIFLFSRLAFLEIPMLTFVFLALLSYKEIKEPIYQVIAAGFFLLLGLLTKTTAIIALPALLYLIWTEEISLKERFIRFFVFLVVLSIPYLIYWIIINNSFHQDVVYFSSINFSKRITPYPQMLIYNLFSFFSDPIILKSPIVWLTFFSTVLTLFMERRWYKDRWLVFIILLTVFYSGLMIITYYHPPRYYIPFLFLACLFCGITMSKIITKNRSGFRWAILICVVSVFMINGILIARYLISPKFSFINMLNQVKEQISATSDKQNDLLIGPFANTVSLETGIPSINSVLGVWNIHQKMAAYQPSYFISLGDDNDLIINLSDQYYFTPIEEYYVFENYYTGKNIILYKINRSH